jgi:leader peptidase (prepilin peptidase)/N-methyltransferase
MGGGDCKLFAALGAWFGWMALPIVLIIAVVFALIVGVIYMGIKRRFTLSVTIPFGPFLSFGGLMMLFFHAPLLQSLYML